MRVELVNNDFHPSAKELANEIWGLDAEEQLELLMELATISDNYHIAMQLQGMMDEKHEYSGMYGDKIDKFVALLNEYLNDDNN